MEHDRPREFGFLIRPTLKEFNEFMLLLDKLISDNLNVEFFAGDVEREIVEERRDGTKVATLKGTIAMLDEWISRFYRPGDPGRIKNMITAFKNIPRLRQSPAHAVRDDDFDQKYFKEQRETMINTYDAVQAIRLMVAEHPAVKGYTVPKWLDKGRIWTQ